MYLTQLAIEAITVAIVLVLAWVFIKPLLPGSELTQVFIIGLLAHIGFELTGLNRLYCTKGAACTKDNK